jgi:hypothetical protein
MNKLHRDGSYRDVFGGPDALQCSTPLHLLYGCTMYVLEALLGAIVVLQPATVLYRTIFGALAHRPTPIPRLPKRMLLNHACQHLLQGLAGYRQLRPGQLIGSVLVDTRRLVQLAAGELVVKHACCSEVGEGLVVVDPILIRHRDLDGIDDVGQHAVSVVRFPQARVHLLVKPFAESLHCWIRLLLVRAFLADDVEGTEEERAILGLDIVSEQSRVKIMLKGTLTF